MPKFIFFLSLPLLSIFGLMYSYVGFPAKLDSHSKSLLIAAGLASSYHSHVSTEVSYQNRQIRVDGEYINDFKALSFQAISTTTLAALDIPSLQTFTLQNIAIQGDIFTKLESNSNVIKKTMPKTNGWKYFASSSIPSEFRGIAVYDPISDNLAILRNNLSYIAFITKIDDRTQGSKSTHLIFKISDSPQLEKAAREIAGRISKDGVIDIWIPDDASSLLMRFVGEHYVSTTTVSEINAVRKIVPPTLAK